MARKGGYVQTDEAVLGLVVIRGFGEFGHLFDHVLEVALRETDVEGDHRHSGMVRCFDLLDAIVNLSSKPASVSQPSRSAAAEENHDNTDASNQREVKCGVGAKALGRSLQARMIA